MSGHGRYLIVHGPAAEHVLPEDKPAALRRAHGRGYKLLGARGDFRPDGTTTVIAECYVRANQCKVAYGATSFPKV